MVLAKMVRFHSAPQMIKRGLYKVEKIALYARYYFFKVTDYVTNNILPMEKERMECAFCNKKLHQEHNFIFSYVDYYCPQNHCNYSFDKNSNLKLVRYTFDPYTITYNYQYNPHQMTVYKYPLTWKFVTMPVIKNIEHLSPDKIINKIKTYIIFS